MNKMKFLAKLLLIAIIAASAYYFGQRNRHSSNQAPAQMGFAAPSLSIHASPVVFQAVPGQRHPDSLADTIALLHAKLRQWQESEINDPDDVEGRAQLLQEMLALVTDANVADIIRSLSAAEMSTTFGSDVLHHWMQLDPITASNWLASCSDTTTEETLTIADDWAGKRAGLQQYIDQLPDTAWKQTFLEDVSSEMSAKDPKEAIRLAQQMKPGAAQTNMLRAVVCGWVSTDPDATMSWVANVSDPALREQLVASTVQSYALSDPAQAASWLVEEVKSEAILKDAALNILNTWVARDPAGAANWAAQFPDGDTKAAAVTLVSSYWQQTDPTAAAAWMQQFSRQSSSPVD
jgi:hypothetical protein